MDRPATKYVFVAYSARSDGDRGALFLKALCGQAWDIDTRIELSANELRECTEDRRRLLLTCNHFDEIISHGRHPLPDHGTRRVALLGSLGVGKSTVLRNLVSQAGEEMEAAASCVCIFLDGFANPIHESFVSPARGAAALFDAHLSEAECVRPGNNITVGLAWDVYSVPQLRRELPALTIIYPEFGLPTQATRSARHGFVRPSEVSAMFHASAALTRVLFTCLAHDQGVRPMLGEQADAAQNAGAGESRERPADLLIWPAALPTDTSFAALPSALLYECKRYVSGFTLPRRAHSIRRARERSAFAGWDLATTNYISATKARDLFYGRSVEGADSRDATVHGEPLGAKILPLPRKPASRERLARRPM